MVIVEPRASIKDSYRVRVANLIAEVRKESRLELLISTLSKEKGFSERDGGSLGHSQPLRDNIAIKKGEIDLLFSEYYSGRRRIVGEIRHHWSVIDEHWHAHNAWMAQKVDLSIGTEN